MTNTHQHYSLLYFEGIFRKEEILLADNYDIIGITESWLNTEDTDFLAEYNIPGFTMFEKE